MTKSEQIDPSSKSYRVKQALQDGAAVLGAAVATAVPVLGLTFFSLSQLFNDSPQDKPLQAVTLVSHLLGASALVVGVAAGAPALLGLGAAGLGVSALASGTLASRQRGGPWTAPFQQSTTYSYPKQAA